MKDDKRKTAQEMLDEADEIDGDPCQLSGDMAIPRESVIMPGTGATGGVMPHPSYDGLEEEEKRVRFPPSLPGSIRRPKPVEEKSDPGYPEKEPWNTYAYLCLLHEWDEETGTLVTVDASIYSEPARTLTVYHVDRFYSDVMYEQGRDFAHARENLCKTMVQQWPWMQTWIDGGL